MAAASGTSTLDLIVGSALLASVLTLGIAKVSTFGDTADEHHRSQVTYIPGNDDVERLFAP